MDINAKDKSLFLTTDQAVENPPRDPFIGTIVDWEFRHGEITQQNGEVRKTLSLVLHIRPEDNFAGYTDPNGNELVYISQNTRTNSIYMIYMGLLNAAMAEATGVAGFKVTDPDQLKNVTLRWKGVSPKDEMWRPMGNRPPTRNLVVPVGAPPANWRSLVPADIEQRRQELVQKAKEREQSRAAGQPVNGPAATDLGTGSAYGAAGAAPTVDLSAHEEVVLAFLRGKERGRLAVAIATDPAFKASVPNDVIAEIVSGRAVQQLLAEGKLTENGGVLA